MPVPRSKSAVRALLAGHGILPARGRGQHFLVDPNFIDAIVREAQIGPEDCVLEVGTGTGILTDALAARAGRLITCDLDRRIQELARGLRDWPDTVTFLAGDILASKHALDPEILDTWRNRAAGGLRMRLVANLPYQIATPLLATLLWEGIELFDAVVLVQKEAADRFLARPGGADYGPLSIAVHLLAEGRLLRRVGPQVFWPRPKVDSALLRLKIRDPARARILRERGLPDLLREGFRHRRKMLRARIDPVRLARAGIDPQARPQEVAPEQWVRLLTLPET